MQSPVSLILLHCIFNVTFSNPWYKPAFVARLFQEILSAILNILVYQPLNCFLNALVKCPCFNLIKNRLHCCQRQLHFQFPCQLGTPYLSQFMAYAPGKCFPCYDVFFSTLCPHTNVFEILNYHQQLIFHIHWTQAFHGWILAALFVLFLFALQYNCTFPDSCSNLPSTSCAWSVQSVSNARSSVTVTVWCYLLLYE